MSAAHGASVAQDWKLCMDEFEIREATYGDMPDIVSMITGDADFLDVPVKDISSNDFENHLRVMLDEKNYIVYIAETPDEIIGVVCVYIQVSIVNKNTLAFIDAIAVKNKAPIKKLHKKLLMFILEKLDDMGIQDVNVILGSRVKCTKDFYMENGFKKSADMLSYHFID